MLYVERLFCFVLLLYWLTFYFGFFRFLLLVDQDDRAMSEEVPLVEIAQEHLEPVQKACESNDLPLLSEFPYKYDLTLPTIKMDLKPTAVLRSYQKESLEKMFQHGRVRSALIVLPCGAGKSLTGVAAVCYVKKRALVLCTSGVAVEQWCNEFRRWTVMDHRLVTRFTSDYKEVPSNNGIIVTT